LIALRRVSSEVPLGVSGLYVGYYGYRDVRV